MQKSKHIYAAFGVYLCENRLKNAIFSKNPLQNSPLPKYGIFSLKISKLYQNRVEIRTFCKCPPKVPHNRWKNRFFSANSKKTNIHDDKSVAPKARSEAIQ